MSLTKSKMKSTTKNKPINCLVHLERTGVTIYSPTLSDVAKFAFPLTMVRDLEIIDLKTLNAELAGFLTKLAIPVGDATIILAQSCYFVQEIISKEAATQAEAESPNKEAATNSADTDPTKSPTNRALEEAQRQDFVKAVPFADVFSSIITVNKHRYIIALNREFYDPIVKILEAHHLKVVRIIPDMAVPEIGQEGLSLAIGTSIFSTVSKNTDSNLIMAAPSMEIGNMQVAPAKGSPERKRISAMVVIFGLLLLVFGFMFYRMYTENQERKARVATAALVRQQKIASASARLALSLTSTPTIQPPSNPTATDPTQLASSAAQLKVVILNGSGQSGQAAIVQTKLATLGFTQSETGNAPTVSSGNTMIVLKPTVPQPIRQLLMTTLTNFGLTPLTTESSELVEDVRIITGSIITSP